MPKRVTIKQIADELNVSLMTVSRALNHYPNVDERTRERVLETARRLGYFPNDIAKSLVKRKTETIGVVVPEITHSFFPEAIRGIEEETYGANYNLMLTHSAEDAQREVSAIETLASKRVDGILISVAATQTDRDIYHQVMKLGIKMVFFDRCVYDVGASCVSIDDENSAKKITEHLIKLGYTKIAHLCGPPVVSIGKARMEGYKKALRKHKLDFKPEWIAESGFHESGGYGAMMDLLSLDKKDIPQAVVAVNDPAAFGAMKAIYEKGLKIPDDIAIVGFSDDIRSDLMPSPLTTVHQPAYEVGKAAAFKLIKHIENKSENREDIVINTEIMIRESCGANLKSKKRR